MLGSDLAAAAPPDVELRQAGAEEIDITDARAVARALDEFRPEWVVNAAAYTRVDRAEEELDAAMAVNGEAVRSLGEVCAARGITVLHYGTDYVFPGDGSDPLPEMSPPNPVNAYGRSKLAGENGLRASGARALILRTQWLFGLRGRSFPRTMWERATRGEPTTVVADQRGRPTYTADLAAASWRLIARSAAGLYHVANAGDASWFDVAARVFARAGTPALVRPCATADFPTRARRPAYSVLDTSRLERDHGIVLPEWTDALDRFLGELRASEGRSALR
jgi:dTDP-4-dehydrorhamnose reductase